ncbi:GDSL-type esterase/lipase family protein [Undibacterium sp. YM2]|uniref:GDSL-type esterase/lipase family protein n=1 Tax=Undibacterium sp. YM2 TaxID=2058625 RepID=UPI00138A53BF|nr:GDSL-type esterase/lipase family protein [Undibacterium sp. YM2]
MKRLILSALLFTSLCHAQVSSLPVKQPTTIASDQNYSLKLAYQIYFNDYITLRKNRPADLIFIGDSITEQWRWGAGSTVWKKRFEERAIDFGLGSDKTQHTIWRLENIDMSAFTPQVAIILIGTNNVQDTPEEIADGVKAVIAATQKKFNGIKIVLLSILPNARATEKMSATNMLLAPLDDQRNIYYLDLAAQLPPVGDNWKGMSKDKLHLSVEGYEIWASALGPLLSTIMNQK